MPPAASGDGALPPVPDDETPTPPVTQLPWSPDSEVHPGHYQCPRVHSEVEVFGFALAG